MTLNIWPMLIALPFMFLGMFVSGRLRSKFHKYAKIRLQNGMTGREIAERMLEYYGIYDVKVTSVSGTLTDHYNPMTKTVNLSHDVYNGANAAAAAVAAHECGHAVQHATNYAPLNLRSKLVPLQNASGMIMNIVIMLAFVGGYALYRAVPVEAIIWVMIATNGILFLFSAVTLPVEFDASKRALVWIEKNGIVTQKELVMSKDALKWAAMTYVVAALSALASLVYWVLQLLGNRD
ncbi:MAG: zinc metallopeptidase [Flavobacteriales bacterium]|nr:zinc metallopeptidase [Flavobacteriales bacterium]